MNLNSFINRRQVLGLFATTLGGLYTFNSAKAQVPPQCPPPPKTIVKVVDSEIAKNHGHEFTIELNELIAKAGTIFSIQGTSGHPHKIQVSNDQLIKLLQGQKVVLASSTDAGHSHQVTLFVVDTEV